MLCWSIILLVYHDYNLMNLLYTIVLSYLARLLEMVAGSTLCSLCRLVFNSWSGGCLLNRPKSRICDRILRRGFTRGKYVSVSDLAKVSVTNILLGCKLNCTLGYILWPLQKAPFPTKLNNCFVVTSAWIELNTSFLIGQKAY